LHALHAGAKAGWRLAWETMVRELAPQDSSGSYTRPANAFNERIGSPCFPVGLFENAVFEKRGVLQNAVFEKLWSAG
jgi:hypothetical protein